ncbi:MAG: transcriptional regulator [Chloroherpetonaceae bacterium]|nr:transcriptional regulator [Chthonomonadaceae bacterium]MDW8207376.1 transcriptional regulator [Chloroherpetonaceae bacterium]
MSETRPVAGEKNAFRAEDAREALEALDEVIHQKVRLGIMSTLLALGEADFKLLRETLALSDGNLSTHLALLEARGYVTVRKEFVRRRPHTSYTPTEAGRIAFQRYLDALERIIRASQPVVMQPRAAHGKACRAGTLEPKNA